MCNFTLLMPLLTQCKSLMLMMSEENGIITVISQPKPNSDSPVGLSKQMQLIGTAAELDAGFADAILSQTRSVLSIEDQISANKAKLDAEKATIGQKSKKVTSSGKNEKPTLADSDDDGLSGDDEDDDVAEHAKATPADPSTGTTAPKTVKLF